LRRQSKKKKADGKTKYRENISTRQGKGLSQRERERKERGSKGKGESVGKKLAILPLEFRGGLEKRRWGEWFERTSESRMRLPARSLKNDRGKRK